jgi:hypothetical protein
LSVSQAALDSAVRGAAPSRTVSRFYAGMAVLLLVLVLLGFGRTLYLRAFFDVRPIGAWVWVHGILLTAWFVGVVLQTALVAARRTDVHRRAGWLLTVLAVAVVATSVWITLGTLPAMLASGFESSVALALAPRIAWGNYASALVFALLVGAAVVLRRQTQAHKRLMLLASIAIITPALARILQWPVFGADLNANFAFAAGLVSYALAGVVAVHDLVALQRLHPATLIGAVLLIGVKLAAALVIAQTTFGRALVPGLS